MKKWINKSHLFHTLIIDTFHSNASFGCIMRIVRLLQSTTRPTTRRDLGGECTTELIDWFIDWYIKPFNILGVLIMLKRRCGRLASRRGRWRFRWCSLGRFVHSSWLTNGCWRRWHYWLIFGVISFQMTFYAKTNVPSLDCFRNKYSLFQGCKLTRVTQVIWRDKLPRCTIWACKLWNTWSRKSAKADSDGKWNETRNKPVNSVIETSLIRICTI